MTWSQLTALLPIILAAATPVVGMLAIAVRRSEPWTLGLTLAGFAATLAMLLPAAGAVPTQVTPLLQLDALALFFIALAALAGAATALLAHTELRRIQEEREELYVLLGVAVLGACVLAASRHFAALFIGLEMMSVALFPLLAYRRRSAHALEAGIKYLVISGVGAGVMLFGMALLYAGLGSLELEAVGRALAAPEVVADLQARIWITGGLVMVLVGLGVKLSLFPLHWWTPDVYEGAPSAVTGFLASVAKGAAVVILLRLLVLSEAHTQPGVLGVLELLAILSMIAGNLLALLQRDVKRILAYSSIAHMGYLMLALVAAGDFAAEAMGLYLIAYFISTLGAFGALALAGPGAQNLEGIRGLFRHRPWVAVSLALMLLSLAGIPLTAGFIGKFYLFAIGVDAALWPLLWALVLGSVVGLFYYLRVILALFSPAGEEGPVERNALTGTVALAGLTLGLLWVGVWPSPAIAIVRWAVGAAQ